MKRRCKASTFASTARQELRCAVDRKLLCDPVVSPGGVAFERSTLQRWLQKHGSCPVTGEALRERLKGLVEI